MPLTHESESDPTKMPRYKQWVKELRTAWEEGKKEVEAKETLEKPLPLSTRFSRWLGGKEPESKPTAGPANAAPSELPDSSTKENAYKRLALQGSPFIKDYDPTNPPQKNLDQALALADEYKKNERIMSVAPSAGLVALVLATFTDTTRPLNSVFGFTITSITTTNIANFWFLVCGVCFVVAVVAFFKRDKTALGRAAYLRKPLRLNIMSDPERYACCGRSYQVVITYESARPLIPDGAVSPTKDQFTLALRHKIRLIIKHWFEGYEAEHRDDPDSDLSMTLPKLRDTLEGLILERICEICHDFQPAVFRYQVTVHPARDAFDGAVPIGEPY